MVLLPCATHTYGDAQVQAEWWIMLASFGGQIDEDDRPVIGKAHGAD